MEIPEYDEKKLLRENMEGEYSNSDFAEFIETLLNDERYDDVEKGILAYVKSNGTINLSSAQKYRLQKLVDDYDIDCSICGESIPVSEVVDNNDGLCSYHRYVMGKDD